MTHPKHQLIVELGEIVNLTCSFYLKTGQRLYWNKDGKKFADGLQMFQLSLLASEPDMQGLYSCVVVDQQNNSIESKQARIQMKGKFIELH